jgi:hypothetical protein
MKLGLGSFGSAPVHEDLPVDQIFVQHHDDRRRLDDAYPARGRVELARTRRQTAERRRIVLAEILLALLVERQHGRIDVLVL